MNTADQAIVCSDHCVSKSGSMYSTQKVQEQLKKEGVCQINTSKSKSFLWRLIQVLLATKNREACLLKHTVLS